MIYDISQPVAGCVVYPGDARPEIKAACSIENGNLYNLTEFSMCAHNGTHVDAPLHFLKDGAGIGEIPPEKFTGRAFVISRNGSLSADDARQILACARAADAGTRILIKGDAVVTIDAAEVFAEAEIDLIGTESQSVGPVNAPMAVHLALLGAQVVLLEGIRLDAVKDGAYFLSCAPINLGHADGAPCRALLWDI